MTTAATDPAEASSTNSETSPGALRKIRNRYMTVQEMLDDVNKLSGFEEVSRSTLFRWLELEEKQKSDPNVKLPAKVERLIQMLDPSRTMERLRIACHEAALYLPARLAQAAPAQPARSAEGRLNFTRRSVFEENHLEIEQVSIESGQEALVKLGKDELDVAFAAAPAVGLSPNSLAVRLCSYCTYYLGILCLADAGKIYSARDLRGRTIGYPIGTTINSFVEANVGQGAGVRPFQDVNEAAGLLLETKEIDTVVVWAPDIDRILDRVIEQKGEGEYRVDSRVLPPIQIELFVNRKASATAILNLLRCMLQLTPNEKLKAFIDTKVNKDLRDAIYDEFGLKEYDSRLLPDYRFELTNVDISAILELWGRSLAQVEERS